MRRLLTLAMVAGCASSANARRDDAGGAVDAATTTACPLAGTAPRASHLHGDGVIALDAGGGGPWPYDLDLYLPDGRVAGAQVLLAFPTHWPADALTVVEGRFDETLAVDGLAWAPIYGGVLGFRGRMDAPDGGLALDLAGNLNGHSDIPQFAEGRAAMCPAGDAPAPTLRAPRPVAPNGRVELVPSGPVGAGADAVRLSVGGAVVPSDVALADGVLVVTARAWLPPSAEVSVDLGGLRDVMGRPFALDAPLAALRTSAVVVDREFTDAPPAGAVAAERTFAVDGGALQSRAATERSPYYALVALGDLGAGQTVVAQARISCSPEAFAVWVVGADGSHTAMPVAPGVGVAQELRASRPAPGPAWLFVESRTERSRPGWRGPQSDCTFALDRVAVE